MGYRKIAMPDRNLLAQMLKTTIFKTLDSGSVNSLREMLEFCQADAGECIRECGDERYALYIIVSGSAHLSLPNSTESFAGLEAGDVFGMLAILFKCESGFDVYADAQTQFLMIDAATMRMLEVSNPQLALAMLRAIRTSLSPIICKAIPSISRLTTIS